MQPVSWTAMEDTSRDFVVDEPAKAKQHGGTPRETDARRLEQRQKQVDLGKNTLAYQRYAEMVPKYKRRRVGHGKPPYDPQTPDPRRVCSKRAFDGEVRAWRRALHRWDDAVGEDEEVVDIKAKLSLTSNPAAPQPLEPSAQEIAQPAEDAPAAESTAQAGPTKPVQPADNRSFKRPAPGEPSQLGPSPRRRLNGPPGPHAQIADQAAMPSPAGTCASEVESFWSTPESGEIRVFTDRGPKQRSRLAEAQGPEPNDTAAADDNNIFANWHEEDEVVI